MSPLPSQGVAAETVAVPPRFWWLKRLALAGLMLILLLLVVRWGWGAYAHHLLWSEIERLRAAGEPVLLEDFRTIPPHSDENAAPLLRLASANWVGINLGQDDEKYLADNAQCFALVREARVRERCDWGIQIASPAVMMNLPHLSPQRNLARSLSDAAVRRHRQGRHDEVVKLAADVVFISEAVCVQPGITLSYLVSMSMVSGLSNAMEPIVGTIAVGKGAGDATEDSLRSLINTLADAQRAREAFTTSMIGERGLYTMDTADLMMSGHMGLAGDVPPSSPVARPIAWVITPMIQLDALHVLRAQTACIEAVRTPDAPPMDAALFREPEVYTPALLLQRPVSLNLLFLLDRTVVYHQRDVTHRRLLALALAIRLHEVTTGQRPQRLDELVPTILQKTPRDMFSPGVVDPIHYEIGVGRPAVLRSVGEDGASGTEDDLLFYLDGDRPHDPDDGG